MAIIFLKKYYEIALWGLLAVLVAGGFIFAAKERQADKDITTLEINAEPRKWGVWVTVRRYIGALLIYLFYWLTLWGSFTRVVGATLSSKRAAQLVDEGSLESIWDYGWGDHYIWFLIFFCFVTYCCGALAGATAKKKGALVASIANIPVIIIVTIFCYFIFFGNLHLDVESPIAWKIVLPLSIVSSIYFSILGGTVGQKSQSEHFSDNTIFGIRSFHWFWLWLISSIYIQSLANCFVKIIVWDFTTDPLTLVGSLVHIMLMLPTIVYGYAVYLMYGILSKTILEHKNIIIRILAFIGCYIGGLIAGGVLELIIYKIFVFVSHLFS
jgi:hypothetical protein